MTGLLEKAIHRLEALPPEEQDAIAADILATLDDELPPHLKELAKEAMEDHRAGRTIPLEDFLKEG
jgi:hypothetical protein